MKTVLNAYALSFRKMHFLKLILIVGVLLGSNEYFCYGEEKSFSTSIAAMEKLLEKERLYIHNLEQYATKLENKLNVIKSAVNAMRMENEKSELNAEEYLSNPLNAFKLIRRMHADWINLELYMQEPVGTEQIGFLQQQHNDLPSKGDLAEAVSAIHRLQTTYDLKPADMAAGILNGKQYDSKLSALDCFSIGSDLFNQLTYYDAGFWAYTALGIYENSDLNGALSFSKDTIWELYAEILLKEERSSDALIVINNALAENPGSARLLNKQQDLEFRIKTSRKVEPLVYWPRVPDAYQRACRGEFDKEPLSNLHCRYNTTTTPFLKLAPLKMEEIHLDPYMVIYHEVLSDKEIDELKHLGKPGLRRATVYKADDKRSSIANERTSQFSWLLDGLSDTTIRVNRRITDMTGFSLPGSEMLQVMNYGLGGHYNTHYDFFNASMTSDVVRMHGDRISTVLFYMSDVEQGGATVFPHLRTALYPQKGSAVVWYNLNNRYEGNWKTLHAACPVIVGSKWVCNKWIRVHNQMFIRPCYKE